MPSQNWQVESLLNHQPLNLKRLKVCANTGDLFEKYCPVSEETWFIPGVSPIKVSNIYRRITVDKNTGLRTCSKYNANSEVKVFEFWPSDFLHIFSQAGISLKTPPPYDPSCSLQDKSHFGQLPIITSPQSSVEYVIQSDSLNGKQIPFSAVVDPDVERLFWFVNGKFAGSAKNGEAFIWQPTNGEFLVSAVDDSGRAASKTIRVLQIR